MRAIMLLFDSLNREFLPNYGCDWTKMPNFQRLGEHTLTFDSFYAGSTPCMPVRRELHTGRYNFMHSSWSPMQPFDNSVISRMKNAGIYTHICTDHFHYWEDGGSGYLTKFNSCEMVRGQQGDPWMGQVSKPKVPDTLSKRTGGENWRHDWINRSFLDSEDKMPQKRTFDTSLDFIDRNAGEDNWFLQIEAFDPHEPFYTQENYKALYPHDYHGKNMDWPDYGKNDYDAQTTAHIRYEYASLLSMCDAYLGKLLDKMDALDLWKDTMLIVNTDHGFMLGEKEWMGKNIQPLYNEIMHIPFFIYDPRYKRTGERTTALAQTVDIVPTLAEFFDIEPPQFMDGVSLLPVIQNDVAVRDYALFGIHGGHVNITDGHYVYMRAPTGASCNDLYEYTLMPMHMNAPFTVEELQKVSLTGEFAFTKGTKVLKVPTEAYFNAHQFGTMLFDLLIDPNQKRPIKNEVVEQRLIEKMSEMMEKNEAPQELYERLGISAIHQSH
ncbi:MAG: sulfatase [Oscillospiraceae bacterium]